MKPATAKRRQGMRRGVIRKIGQGLARHPRSGAIFYVGFGRAWRIQWAGR